MKYLRMPGGEQLGQWVCPQWKVHSGHRSHSHKEPQTPSLQTLLDPWLPQCQEILARKREKKSTNFIKSLQKHSNFCHKHVIRTMKYTAATTIINIQ